MKRTRVIFLLIAIAILFLIAMIAESKMWENKQQPLPDKEVQIKQIDTLNTGN